MLNRAAIELGEQLSCYNKSVWNETMGVERVTRHRFVPRHTHFTNHLDFTLCLNYCNWGTSYCVNEVAI